MKTWISYLAATAFGLAATLVFGESSFFQQATYTVTAVLVQLGGFILIPFVFFSFSAGIASLRKDGKGCTFARTTILWSVFSTLLLALSAAAVFRFLPLSFPASTSAGKDPAYLSGVSLKSFSTLLGHLSIVNPFYTLMKAEDFLLPVLIIAFFLGWFLKPNVEIIRPAYVVMNSFSETFFRLARAWARCGAFFLFFISSHWLVAVAKEGTVFVILPFLLILGIVLLLALFVVLPLLLALFSLFSVNPYRILYRMIAPALAGMFTGSIFFATPTTMSLARSNLSVQKRVGGTAIPLYTLIGRGGSALVSTLATLTLVHAATGSVPEDRILLIIALTSALFSFVSPLYLGFEVFFITTLTLDFLKIDLYGAHMSMVALMPILNGAGVLIDTYVASFGAAYTCSRMGVLVKTPHRDIV
ncbi:MAG: cation:dicarboxylase symporter family transporter [Spirochaetales bacterium]|nr:cation:dicarboxylase symporter family transporter [Spirochaetales bacterium]